ncbi:MAG: prepilin-type N-terminal cleavage/methylation domain-containing protein [Gemmatimonadales bacterium]
MRLSSRGLTLVEVLVAVVVLGVGVIALVGTSALVTRMIGRGKVETRAALVASSRMEALRLAAHATSPRCTAPEFATGGPAISGGMTESWVVPTSGRVRRVRVTVTYLTARGPRQAELETAVEC